MAFFFLESGRYYNSTSFHGSPTFAKWNSLKLFQDGNSLEKKLWCCVGGISINENNLGLSTELYWH